MSIAREYTDARAMREAIRAVKIRLNTPPRKRDILILQPLLTYHRYNHEIGYQFPIGPTKSGLPLGFSTTSIKQIIGETAAEFGYTVTELLSHRRTSRLCFVRQYAMWRCRNETPRSLPEIARRFGGRDHTTCLHAVRKIDALHKAGVLMTKLEALR